MKFEIKKGESFKDKSKELQLKNNNKDDNLNKFLIVFNEQTKDFRIEKVKDNDFNLEEELSESFQNISDDEDTHNINNQSTSNTSSNDQATNSSQKLDKRPLSLNDFIKSNSSKCLIRAKCQRITKLLI